MNIVVIGIGGIGGYFGGRLVQAGYNVTFVARGNHYKAIKKDGLQVKSILGDFVVYPTVTDRISNVKNPDVILLGVKSWQIIDIAKQLQPILSETTLILPLQNGADNAERLQSVLGSKNVLGGLCKIVSKIEAPGVINHFAYDPEIVFGEMDHSNSERTKTLKRLFDKAQIKTKLSKNIHLDIWQKFLFIVTVSGIGALTRSIFGIIRAQKELRQIMRQTAEEIVAIANAKQIELSNSDIDLVMQVVDNLSHETTASMQRDIMDGKPSELESFNGYIVREGKRLEIATPTNDFIYYTLLPQELQARR